MAPVLAFFLVLNMAQESGPKKSHIFCRKLHHEEQSNAPNAGAAELPFSSWAQVQCYGGDASASIAPASIPAGPPGSPPKTPSLALIKFYFSKRDCLLFCRFPRYSSVVDSPPAESTTRRLVPCFAASPVTVLS